MEIVGLNLVKWIAAGAIPALIAIYAPPRWRAPAMLLWLVLPLLLALLPILSEIARNPSALADEFQTLGFVGAFVAMIWIGVSLTGYAIGVALRKNNIAPKRGREAPPRPSAGVAPRAAIAAALPISGWRARHVGFERDGLILDGLDIWAADWRRVNAPAVELPHPAHPGQTHAFRTYEAGHGAGARRFAATELSNGVWGFYTRDVQEEPPAGGSADGSLRFENSYGEFVGGRPANLAPTAYVWSVATGELLADGSAWTSSRVLPQEDGALLLALRHYNRDALFRLDPKTRTFRVLGERRPDESLSRLSQAVDRAFQEGNDKAKAYMGLRLAPDGSLRVDLAAAEWSNTHWVNSPRVTEVATGRVLLDLWGADWDAEVAFPQARCVDLDLRRYRVGGRLQARIDAARERFTIHEPTSGPAIHGPLAKIKPALEAASRRAAAAKPRAQTPRRIGVRQAFVALLILIGALFVIGATSVVVLRLNPEPPVKLTPLPKMPG